MSIDIIPFEYDYICIKCCRQDLPSNKINIKIADYGISRVSLPSGIKGFGGTEGFMAPEIMKHNGEEEYTEKVNNIKDFFFHNSFNLNIWLG